MSAINKSTHVNRETMEQPATDALPVTPSNDAELPFVTRALYVGTQGNVKVKMYGNQEEVIFVGVVGLLPVRVDKVLSTGTDADDIVALW